MTTYTPTALELAKELGTFYVLGDTPGLLARIAPDACCRIPGNPRALPWAGTYVGQDFERFHQRAKDTVELLQFRFVAEQHGDALGVLLFDETCRVKATGRSYRNEFLGVLSFREGQVARYLEFGDTAAMEAACEPAGARPALPLALALEVLVATAPPADARGLAAIAVAQQLLTAFTTGEATPLLAPEAQVRLYGDPVDAPWPRQGAIAAMLTARAAALEGLACEVLSAEAHGDMVLVFWHEHARVRATGRAYVSERVALVTMADGHVSRWLDYGDTAAVQAAL